MKELLEEAAKAYYEGTPFLSDEEYDQLESKYGSNSVGYQVTDGIPHMVNMKSLQKCFDLDKAPLNLEDCIKTPKLDGAAVSLVYVNGAFETAITRGDGKVGKDCTGHLTHILSETAQHVDLPGITVITGEVVCPSSVKNARNVAAGSLNLKDSFEVIGRELTFVAYDIRFNNGWFDTYTEMMDFLHKQGFNAVTHFDASEYPTDGEVYRLESLHDYIMAGETSHHPKGAFAFKVQKDAVPSVLLGVEWQVGKSGVVSPVAILEPVEIGGATVSRATLHNMQYIDSLGLEIGCQVGVIRSGDIIPRIVERLD